MTGEQLSIALQSRQYVYGTVVISTAPIWLDTVKNSGADFVFIDTEHTPIDRTTLSWMCQAYGSAGFPPIVRIPSPDPTTARMALDGGASGIIAPYVESAEQVWELVEATKLRPLKGKLAKSILHGHETLKPDIKEYIDNFNRGNILIVTIESAPGIENLDEILSVPGLDAVLVGPHDLSVSLGIPEQYQDEIYKQAVQTIILSARNRDISAGIIYFMEDMDQEIEWAGIGANLIVHRVDYYIFSDTLRKDMTKLRRVLDTGPHSSST